MKFTMKNRLSSSFVCAALLALTPFTALPAEPASTSAETPTIGGDAVLVSATASVESINYDTREVSLLGPRGNTVTFTVDPAVKRLAEISVGDVVRVDYYVSVVTELRQPTPEEIENPVEVVAASGLAPAEDAPGVMGARQLKVVATIEGLDVPTQSLTVMGPMGNLFTAMVKDPAELKKLRLGEPIVLTFTEALAISLEKIAGAKAP